MRLRIGTAAAGTAPLRAIAQMAAAFAASDLLRSAMRLATSLVIARGLGRSGFGRWTLYMAAASALTAAFDLGFGVLLTREAARDSGRSRTLVAGALTARLVLFVPVGAWLCARPAAVAVFGSTGVAYAMVGLVGASLTYGCLAAVFRADPARLVVMLSLEGCGAAALGTGAYAIVSHGGGVLDLLWLEGGVLAAQSGAAVLLLRLIAPREERLPRPIARSWNLLKRALPFAAGGVIANAQARLGPLLLGALSGPAEVAAFGVATRLESTARRFPYAAFGAALPVFSSAAGRPPSVRTRFDSLVRRFAIGAGLLLIAAAGPLVRITYGPRFGGAAIPLMWAGGMLVPSLVNASRRVYLNATGRERVVVRWNAVALAVQVAAALALIPRLGASGAVVAAGVGELAIWAPLRAADRNAAPDRERDAPVARPAASQPA